MCKRKVLVAYKGIPDEMRVVNATENKPHLILSDSIPDTFDSLLDDALQAANCVPLQVCEDFLNGVKTDICEEDVRRSKALDLLDDAIISRVSHLHRKDVGGDMAWILLIAARGLLLNEPQALAKYDSMKKRGHTIGTLTHPDKEPFKADYREERPKHKSRKAAIEALSIHYEGSDSSPSEESMKNWAKEVDKENESLG